MEEFTSQFTGAGLLTWRAIVATNDPIFSSQNIDPAFLNRLETDARLHSAVCGDKTKVLCPCNPAPSSKSVVRWMEKKQEKKDSEKKCNGKKIDGMKDELNDIHKTVVTQMDTNMPKIVYTPANTFLSKDVDFNDSVDWHQKELPVSVKKTMDKVTRSPGRPSLVSSHSHADLVKEACILASSGNQRNPSSESGSVRTLTTSTESEGLVCSTEKSNAIHAKLVCPNEEDSQPIQSTPLKWTSDTELFNVTCTPISGTQRKASVLATQFRGPKHCPPRRQLSANMQTSLRRSLLASQAQVCRTKVLV